MQITDELERLSKLHKDGALSDEEFAQAKRKILGVTPTPPEPAASAEALGEAANRYVTFQMVMGVVGLILFVIFFFAVIFPNIQGRARFGPSLELQKNGLR